jgi:hypothetical protein
MYLFLLSTQRNRPKQAADAKLGRIINDDVKGLVGTNKMLRLGSRVLAGSGTSRLVYVRGRGKSEPDGTAPAAGKLLW